MKQPHKSIIKSYHKASSSQIEAVIKDTAIERLWLKSFKPFTTNSAIAQSVSNGQLVKVEANEDYLPIMRFRNPELNSTYPPYLLPTAKKMLDEIGHLWRQAASKAGVEDVIRLSVTSLVRSVEYQEHLVTNGKLAALDSAHTYGWAFDMDARGYYYGEESVAEVAESEQRKYQKSFEKLGIATVRSPIDKTHLYDSKVLDMLDSVLEDLQEKDLIHFVHELPGTQSSTFHICVKPPQNHPSTLSTINKVK